MQTPTGHEVSDAQIIAADWFQVIFNPSFPYRYTHMMLASGLTASFLIAGLSAWRLLKAPGDGAAARTLRTGIVVAAVLAPLQAFMGDQHGLNTLEHQPAKIAAMEALWHTQRRAPLVLFAIPNAAERRNDYSIEIPGGASWILKHDSDAEVRGLADFAPDTPPVLPLFLCFRLMVGMGILMIALSWFGAWQLRKGARPKRWLLWVFAGFTFSGWVVTLAGWMVTEIGRQPWLVTGLLRTADAAGDASGAQLGASLTAYVCTYALMLIAYMIVLTHLAGQGGAPLADPREKAFGAEGTA